MPKLAGNQKSMHVTQNYEDEPKNFWGCENVFGDDLRIIGKPNKILGREENIFGHKV